MQEKLISLPLRSEAEARTYWQNNPGKPYIIEVSRDKQCLYYYGIYQHTYSADHPMMEDIEQSFLNWLNKTQAPRIVLEEGGKRTPPVQKEEAQANGEAVFTAWLAEQQNIEHGSPEPSEALQRQLLLEQGFTRDQIQYYFFALSVNQYWDMKTDQPFTDYINTYLESDRSTSGWLDYDFSLEHMYAIHKQIWGSDFGIDPEFGIIEADSPIREIVDAAGKLRDQHIVQVISGYWAKGYSVFVVYGGSHAVIQEPAIKSLLQAH